MTKSISLGSAMLCITLAATSQNIRLSGKVTDAKDGSPLAGVSVAIQNYKAGVTTDPDGNYFISVPSGKKHVLVFSSVGFRKEERTADRPQTLNVSLQAGSNTLQEILVVAYGTQRKTNITGSLATVKGGDLQDKPFSSIDKTLQGAVAGLQSSSASGAPGSATDVRIRGIGSINAGSGPLWVIDGAIATTGSLTSHTTSANALSSINPNDIESITVLKDAASTAIYGSRAANGVILVTTKKGKAEKTKLNFSTEIGTGRIAFKPTNKPMTTLQNRQIFREALINAGYVTDIAGADSLIADPVNGFGFNPDYVNTNTDWLKVITQSASQQQYNISVSGGDPKTQFYASAGYFKQEGLTLATGFRRYNGAFSITHKPNDRITFMAGINGSFSTLSQPKSSGDYSNPVSSLFFLQPWYSPYNEDGSVKYNDPGGQFTNSSGNFNPLAVAALDNSSAKTINFRGYVSGEAKLTDNLRLTSRYSAEYFDINENAYLNPLYGEGFALGGGAYADYKRVFDWTWSNYLDYRGNVNKAKDIYFEVKAGFEAQRTQIYLLNASGQNFPKVLALHYLASAATPTLANSLPTEQTTNSLFSVADFNYKDRYVISGSYRRDGSSVFGSKNRWGNFYSAGASWNVNEEGFLKNSNLISLLKLRGSYGESGNSSDFGFYSALPTYGAGYNPATGLSYNYGPYPGTAFSNVGNPNLTWEKNKIFNIGLDFGLWTNRFTGTVEYYNRITSNLLLYVPFSLTAGVAGQNQNVGAMRNKGIEISLGGKPLVIKNFTWEISANFAHNTNKVEKLYRGTPILNGRFQITEGHDVQEYYTRIWAGVDPANGEPLWYTDATHSKKTSDISQVALSLTGKSASPKYFGSVTNTFTYNGISLLAQFNYNYGNYVYDQWASYTASEGAYVGNTNQLTMELTSWKKPGDITNVPQIIYGGNNNSFRGSTRYLYKGDYVRLRNLQVGYSLPKSLLQRAFIASASIYVRGTNLFVFGHDKNIPFDPEQGITGIADFNVFMPKTLTVGLNLGL